MKLVKFLMKMKGEIVEVQLKNGTIVKGKIVSVDIKMNLHLQTVELSIKDRASVKLENYSIRGNQIRHIVLPQDLPIETLLIEDRTKIPRMNKERQARRIQKKKNEKKNKTVYA